MTQLDDMDDGGDQGQPTPLTRRRKLSSAGKVVDEYIHIRIKIDRKIDRQTDRQTYIDR